MRVFTNTAVSIDGKIADRDRTPAMFSSKADLRRMRALRSQADAVLVGGATFRAWPLPLTERPFERPAPITNAVLTARGVLDAEARRWPDPRARLLVLGPDRLDAEAHRARFGAEVITSPAADPVWALDVLAARGCRSILVEGGGGLIAPLVAAGRVDTLHVTVCPVLIGGASAPTLLDGAGFASGGFPRLSLRALEREGDELFLVYDVAR